MLKCLILSSIFLKQVECFHLTNRIINGSPVQSIDEAPFVASLEWFGIHICGASIISRTKIITAAHCTKRVQNVQDLKVRAGTIMRFCNGRLFDVKTIHQHPNFDSKLDYDVSILDMWPLPLNEKIAIIPLANQNQAFKENAASIYGWGSITEKFYDPSNHLKTVQVKIIDHERCKEFLPFISESMLCAGFMEGGKDACQGDSGGPLVVNGFLVGITSFGIGCGQPEAPGVYTYVAKVRDFIDRFM